MKVKQRVNAKGVQESIANGYVTFETSLSEVIDNGASADGDLNIDIDLSDKADKITVQDTGHGVATTIPGAHRILTVGDRKNKSQRDSDLNRHGQGIKGFIYSTGTLEEMVFTTKTSKSHMVIQSIKFKDHDAILDIKKYPKGEKYDFETGLRIVINGTRLDGNKGLSIYEEDEKTQIKRIEEMFSYFERIYLDKILEGVKIKFTITRFGKTLFKDRVLKFIPLSNFAELFHSSTFEKNGLKVRIDTYFLDSELVKGTAYDLSYERRKEIVQNGKSIIVSSASEHGFGYKLKDGAFSNTLVRITVLEGYLETVPTKSGFINGPDFQTVKRWETQHHKDNFKKALNTNLSFAEYCKMKRNEKDQYNHENMINIREEELISERNKRKAKAKIKRDFKLPGNMEADLVEIHDDFKTFTIYEMKTGNFGNKERHQVFAYYLSALKCAPKGYEVKLHIMCEKISSKMADSLFEIINKENLTIEEVDCLN